MKPAAIFLDRDGVLNRPIVVDGKPGAPLRLEDFEILPDVPEALAQLKRAGYALVVVTNQPDAAREPDPARSAEIAAAVDAMHAKLRAELPIDEVRVCPHGKDEDCACRKPRPGLLLNPPTYDVARSAMVGDRWRDVEAGRSAGCRATIFIDVWRYREPLLHEPDVRVASLGEAADWILTHMGNA